MKNRRFFLIIAIFIAMLSLTSCRNKTKSTKEGVKIIFELEGGTYQSSKLPVVFYYPFGEGSSKKVTDPTTLTKQPIENPGYELEGWYLNKNTVGESVQYENKWNFETQSVNTDTLTLYAKWKKKVNHNYCLYYFNESGEKVLIDDYNAVPGQKFSETMGYKNLNDIKVLGNITPVAYVDKDGNPWDMEFTHPGGDNDVSIEVYVKCVSGKFATVATDKELSKYIGLGNSIYLLNDIDMQGKEFNLNNFSKNIEGNNFKIHNFKLQYSARKDDLVVDYYDDNQKSIVISLFKDLKDQNISNVSFSDVTLELEARLSLIDKIYCYPLATKLESSTLNNVNFEGEWSIKVLPTDFNLEDLIFVNDVFKEKDEESKIVNCVINFNKKGE